MGAVDLDWRTGLWRKGSVTAFWIFQRACIERRFYCACVCIAKRTVLIYALDWKSISFESGRYSAVQDRCSERSPYFKLRRFAKEPAIVLIYFTSPPSSFSYSRK